MRLSWSVGEGPELDTAVLGAGGVRAAVMGSGGVKLISTVIPVEAESPEAPVAKIVYMPGGAFAGMVMAIEKEPFLFEVVEPRITPWLPRVRVIDSSGAKFWPVTFKGPPGDEIAEVVAIRAPMGPSGFAKAAIGQPSPTTRAAVAHAMINLRLIATIPA